MKNLYPLKFTPIFIPKVWGGQNLKNLLNKNISNNEKIGESWELSAVQNNVSVVKNGFLAGNNIEELIEIYMGELVGDQVYMKYGIEFPLLFKFIEANENLSVQVHPDNDVARNRHFAYGKTEMWYIINCKKNTEIVIGFNEKISKNELLAKIDNNTLTKALNFEKINAGDVFYIPAGRVHALLKGTLLAEIQQTSDITYRIFDWNRVGLSGKPRDLHIDLALDVIDFNLQKNYKVKYSKIKQQRNNLVNCPFFSTNYIEFNGNIELNYSKLDSFVVYMCIDGKCEIEYEINKKVPLNKGETILIPAEIDNITIIPLEETKILETYIPFVYTADDK